MLPFLQKDKIVSAVLTGRAKTRIGSQEAPRKKSDFLSSDASDDDVLADLEPKIEEAKEKAETVVQKFMGEFIMSKVNGIVEKLQAALKE